MNGDATPPDIDPGLPIKLLTDAELPPAMDFIGRVRRKIQRRTTTSQFASYTWHMPGMILLEMLSMFGYVLKASSAPKDSPR